MTYTPYLISNYSTGLDKRLQPWLIPDDAQEQLLDGYVYRGVMSKREGYNYFAIGERNGTPYRESRIVDRVPAEPVRTSGGVLVLGNGTPGPYTFRLQNTPITRGSVVITAGAQTASDNGLGSFTTSPAGGSGTINYTTGDVTITFANNVAGATQIYALYLYHPGLPVMGVMNFVTSTNVKELIVADTKRLNKYDSNDNILTYLGLTLSITGITNAANGVVTTSAAHNLTTGDHIFITGVLGMNEVNNREFTITVTGGTTFDLNVDTSGYGAYTSGGTVEYIFSGNNFNFFSWVNYADKDGNPRLIFTNNKDQIGYYAPHLTPSVGEYVNYPTAAAPDFQMLTDAGSPITTITCLQLFEFKDRLIMLRTTENGIIRPKRIRISGTGANSDNFLTSATGAGFIDIPDGSWIMGATFNRDDLIIFTEQSTWVLKYTGNDTTPFVLDKIDESRGSGAPFSAFTYLNRTSAASPRGLIISDGYRVERQDELIPDFSFNEVDGANFALCFAGVVDADRDHYLIYPTPEQSESKRILTTNYDEDNYSIYRFPLSCMGTYVTAFDITWNDLIGPDPSNPVFPNWDSFASVYGDWNSFAYTAGAPFSIGGGHKGEIWRLNVTQSEDNPVKVRNIVKTGTKFLTVTTDWNNFSLNTDDEEKGADVIQLTGISGMVEANYQQYPIESITDNYTFVLNVTDNSNFSSFTSTSIGEAQRVIPFDALFKKFNPFVDNDKKVRCGWLYMYVSTTGTDLRRNVKISNITQTNPCTISTPTAHSFVTGDQVNIFSVGGMTELNDNQYFITVLSPTSFSLDGVDATGFTAYTSGGYAAVSVPAKAVIEIYANDNNERIQLNNPTAVPGNNLYQGNCTNFVFEDQVKKWYKVFINQTGKFIQFRVKNLQAGAQIHIHATMPGFQPVGRLI